MQMQILMIWCMRDDAEGYRVTEKRIKGTLLGVLYSRGEF